MGESVKTLKEIRDLGVTEVCLAEELAMDIVGGCYVYRVKVVDEIGRVTVTTKYGIQEKECITKYKNQESPYSCPMINTIYSYHIHDFRQMVVKETFDSIIDMFLILINIRNKKKGQAGVTQEELLNMSRANIRKSNKIPEPFKSYLIEMLKTGVNYKLTIIGFNSNLINGELNEMCNLNGYNKKYVRTEIRPYGVHI